MMMFARISEPASTEKRAESPSDNLVISEATSVSSDSQVTTDTVATPNRPGKGVFRSV